MTDEASISQGDRVTISTSSPPFRGFHLDPKLGPDVKASVLDVRGEHAQLAFDDWFTTGEWNQFLPWVHVSHLTRIPR